MTTKSERYKKGMETLSKMTDEQGVNMIKGLGDFYPPFEELIVAFGFGDIYSRNVLDLKQRELITLTSLIASGAFEQLSFHVNAALRVGIKPIEILELIVHCAAYVGFPKANSAFSIVRTLFEEQNIKLEFEEEVTSI